MNAARTHISPYGWVMIFMLLGLGAINFADKAVLGLAAMPIIRELHLSPTQYGLVSGSFFLLFALSSVVVTAWSDRIGTQRVLALLATSWAIVQVATVFVFSFLALLLTRVLLGAGEGPSYGTSVSAATRGLSGFISPLVTGLITQAAGKNVASGLYHSYQLASLLLLIGGVTFLAFARPDEQLAEKFSGATAQIYS